MIVAVANLKGGTGKTTTAVYLAHFLSAVVVDADPQGSALGWVEAAAEAGGKFTVEVVHLPDSKLASRLPKAGRLVIDCSPRDHRITDAAIEAADLVVIPTGTTSADMDRTWATLDLAKQLGTPAAVLLVKVRVGTRSLAAAVEALAEEHATVLEARIPQREALAVAWGQPLTSDPYGYDLAAQQIKELLHA
jgi:chromosome partitioning protein